MKFARRWDARTVRTVILEIRASDAVTICRRTGVNQTAGAGRTGTEMDEYISKQVAFVTLVFSDALGDMTCGQMAKVLDVIKTVPTADVAPVVRCRDCKHWKFDHTCREHSLVSPMGAEEFCSRGEWKEGDGNG